MALLRFSISSLVCAGIWARASALPAQPPAACKATLTKQISATACTEGTTFGCYAGVSAAPTMWADKGCNAEFTCNGVDVLCRSNNYHRSNCSCLRPPPPPPPVCHVGTVCAAAYSGNGEGCCPYDNAVCCPNKQTCCPAGSTCKDSGTYGTTCVGAPANESVGLSVCKPGAAGAMSTTKKNVLIIGDSVSIGYTPDVARHMADVALVQHSPLDTRDGGAEETAYGVQCLDYLLRSPAGVLLRPDVIMFNWGLHDGPLSNNTVPGQAGLPDVYAAQLEVITQKLAAAEPQAKLLFALTSPSMCNPKGDGCVVNLNNQAKAIMQRHGIPTINLHDAIVKQCGPPSPKSACWGHKGCFCPHCPGGGPGQGYDWLANTTIVPALRALL